MFVDRTLWSSGWNWEPFEDPQQREAMRLLECSNLTACLIGKGPEVFLLLTPTSSLLPRTENHLMAAYLAEHHPAIMQWAGICTELEVIHFSESQLQALGLPSIPEHMKTWEGLLLETLKWHGLHRKVAVV